MVGRGLTRCTKLANLLEEEKNDGGWFGGILASKSTLAGKKGRTRDRMSTKHKVNYKESSISNIDSKCIFVKLHQVTKSFISSLFDSVSCNSGSPFLCRSIPTSDRRVAIGHNLALVKCIGAVRWVGSGVKWTDKQRFPNCCSVDCFRSGEKLKIDRIITKAENFDLIFHKTSC